jgi:hypothetical protein
MDSLVREMREEQRDYGGVRSDDEGRGTREGKVPVRVLDHSKL